MRIVRSTLLAGLFCLAIPALAAAATAPDMVWIGAWGDPPAPPPPGSPDIVRIGRPAPAPGEPPANMPIRLTPPPGLTLVPSDQNPDLTNVTIRKPVRISAAAKQLRIRLSNEDSDAPLAIGSVRVSRLGPGGALTLLDSHVVTFDGRASVIAPSGAPLISDPIDMPVQALETLIVSVYVPGAAHKVGHIAWQYVTPGPDTDTATPVSLMKIPVLITRVDIAPVQPKSVLVALGDSITEGDQSTTNAFKSWPDRLAERLNAADLPWAMVNAGIGGNRQLHNGRGPNTLARLDRDVLSTPGARAVILLEGINDIGRSLPPAGSMTPDALKAAGPASESVTADDLIWADKQIIARAHAQGLRIFGATLTPFKGSSAYTEAREQIRETLNHWILTTDLLDGAIDFDAAVRDPADPKAYREGFTGLDHLHPNDAGYAAMAAAVNLGLFGEK